MLCATGLYAQGTKVQGTITSKEDGQPLAGVTVMIKGTFTGYVYRRKRLIRNHPSRQGGGNTDLLLFRI